MPPSPLPDDLVLVNVYDIVGANALLHPLGIGVHHTGVQCFGTEVAYGRGKRGTGIFEVEPRQYPQHKYRETLVVGVTKFTKSEFHALLRKMADEDEEWLGDRYHIIKRNCNHFAELLVDILLQHHLPEAHQPPQLRDITTSKTNGSNHCHPAAHSPILYYCGWTRDIGDGDAASQRNRNNSSSSNSAGGGDLHPLAVRNRVKYCNVTDTGTSKSGAAADNNLYDSLREGTNSNNVDNNKLLAATAAASTRAGGAAPVDLYSDSEEADQQQQQRNTSNHPPGTPVSRYTASGGGGSGSNKENAIAMAVKKQSGKKRPRFYPSWANRLSRAAERVLPKGLIAKIEEMDRKAQGC